MGIKKRLTKDHYSILHDRRILVLGSSSFEQIFPLLEPGEVYSDFRVVTGLSNKDVLRADGWDHSWKLFCFSLNLKHKK